MSETTDVELSHCDWCNDAFDSEYAAEHGQYGDSNICTPCQNDYAFRCFRCGETTPSDDSRWIESASDYVCDPCCDNYYWWCNDCDRYISNYDNCGCDSEDNDDDAVIHEYNYKPYQQWYVRQIETNTIVKTSKYDIIRNTPFMGFELEIECDNGNRYSLATDINNSHGSWLYCKHDGSLEQGFEIVSHPHSLAAFNLRDWSWISKLQQAGARSWNTGTCGLHVHINKTAFKNNSHIWRFTNLVLYNRHQSTRLAGRNDNQWASFTKEYKQVGKILKGDLDPERYTAVNLRNMETIEVRMFRGSLHEPRIRAALEFVNANFEYTKPLTSYDVLKNDAMSWWSFTAWVEQNQSTYPHLMQYLTKIKERSDRVSTLL